eukprot:TRINITY_DN7790_c0_g1_i1.p1 TRINITY_DN7790_c0_g1~~TRINITY_DN7790_c0_g1_i1.p1  ORF type:complete len:165 (+),score=24.72 TRINITY_DN7790_c0_g1_i1:123-617(+)
MALYLRARDYKKQITAAHFAAADRAANRNMIEFRAAIDIQRFVRGCFARGRIHHKHRAATKIQKVFRGYVGRKIVHQKVNEAQQRNRRSFFNKMATQIQKIFRGFYSRKYLHDYYARKHYIDAILKKVTIWLSSTIWATRLIRFHFHFILHYCLLGSIPNESRA